MSPVTTAAAAEPKTWSVEELRQPFQKAVAGTFYRTMMKAVRSTEHKTPYLNGGTAEQIFKSQLDDHLADTFAETHGETFAGELFEHMAEQMTGKGRGARGEGRESLADALARVGDGSLERLAQAEKSASYEEFTRPSSLASRPSHVNALA